ncbi:MFS transporter [Ruegeria sp. WL0004]|uniref:MFS transporter n=1 Tax=Ruegeria marisflavi TaxID=2984152 RepID=A0ABT2WX51_9RHOB|nr:MFS transporter [Ruegeria sp. WL0004]MCU9840484.1 MFS transporter [Ruegeria sp. WL0004]
MTQTDTLPAYRWVIAIAAGLILGIGMGATMNGITAYIVPMEEAFGWSRSQVSTINVIGLIGLAIGGVVMGAVGDRFGTRPVALFGSVILGVCYLAASQATALWQLYLLMAIAGFFGAASIFAPMFAAVGNWFPVGAGLAIGIASAGQALGQGTVPYVSSILIEAYGTSATLAITGFVMLAVMVPLSLLISPPPQTGASGRAMQSARDAQYPPEHVVIPALCAAIFLCCTCMSVPLVHLVPLIRDRGFSNEEAGGVIFIMLMAGIAGRVAFGKLVDVIGAVRAYMTAVLWMTAMILGFTMIESLGTFKIYAVIYGFGYAGVMTGILASTATLTHPTRRGAALGKVNMFGALGHANGGFLGGLLFDFTGGYELAYGVAAAAGVLNLLLVGTVLLKPRGQGPLAA